MERKKGIAYLPLLISQGDEDKIRSFTKSTLQAAIPLTSPINTYSFVLRLVRRAGSGLDLCESRRDKPRVFLSALLGQR